MDFKEISVRRQCELLGIPRSSVYYQPVSDDEDEYYKLLIFEEYKGCPFYGYRKITEALRRKGHWVNRKRVYRLMREMGLKAIYPKPNLSKPAPGHEIYPYLLRGLAIDHPNQVWATDITYSVPGVQVEHGSSKQEPRAYLEYINITKGDDKSMAIPGYAGI